MAEKTWELLKQDVTLAMKPLIFRRTTYEDGAAALRNTLVAFFLNEDVAATLIEPEKLEHKMFNFNLIKDQMAQCLIDVTELALAATYLKQALGVARPSLIMALDAQILNCGLPFLFENDSYQLTFDKPFTQNAHNFMMQFAHALTLYRVYLHIYEVYFNLLNDSFLNLERDNDCLNNAEFLKKRYSEGITEEELPELSQQLKAGNKNTQSRLNLLYADKENYKNTFESESKILPFLFTLAARKLEACYRGFPNDSTYTFLFYDTSWHKLLKNIANSLFGNQYTYSSFNSTITILSEFSDAQNREITTFQSMVLDKLIAYKVAFLSEARRIGNEILLNVRAKAAIAGISLAYNPNHNFFQPSNTIYYYLYEGMMARGLLNNSTMSTTPNLEEHASDNAPKL